MKDVPVRATISNLKGIVDTDAVMSAWDDDLRIPEWAGSPVWIHGDYAPGNVLPVNGRLSAIIGFSGVDVGDPSDGLLMVTNATPMTKVRALGTTVRAEAMLVYPLRAGWRGADSCR